MHGEEHDSEEDGMELVSDRSLECMAMSGAECARYREDIGLMINLGGTYQ